MAAYCNGAMSYSNTGGCYGAGKHGHGDRTMSYSNTTDVVKCYGGSEQGQGYYKREDRQHKSRERVGEVGALAAGAFALYAYQEHREQKQAGYGGGGAPKQHRGPALDE